MKHLRLFGESTNYLSESKKGDTKLVGLLKKLGFSCGKQDEYEYSFFKYDDENEIEGTIKIEDWGYSVETYEGHEETMWGDSDLGELESSLLKKLEKNKKNYYITHGHG